MKYKCIALITVIIMVLQTTVPVFAVGLKVGESVWEYNCTDVQKSSTDFLDDDESVHSRNVLVYEPALPKKDVSKETCDDQTSGEYENLKYEISDGKVTITGCTSNLSSDIIIPEAIEGYPVTRIGKYSFSHCTSITSVKMISVLTVDEYAFNDCSSLTSVDMPKVQSIDAFAFAKDLEMA